MALNAEVRLKITINQTKSFDAADPRYSPVIEKVLAFASGVGANQADEVYVDIFSIAASGSATYDLNAALTDALGQSVAAVEMVGYAVFADSTNTNNILLGGAASNQTPIFQGTSGGQTVKPGGFATNFAPNASGLATITAATGDIFALANSSSGTAVTGTAVFILRSA